MKELDGKRRSYREGTFDGSVGLREAGVYDAIKRAGLSFFSLDLATRRGDEVLYWLNPCAQHLYRSGWYSVDDLLAWTRGEGPIVKGAKR